MKSQNKTQTRINSCSTSGETLSEGDEGAREDVRALDGDGDGDVHVAVAGRVAPAAHDAPAAQDVHRVCTRASIAE